VIEQLGDPNGVLIADESGFLKKRTRSPAPAWSRIILVDIVSSTVAVYISGADAV
jgi:hypothetical protein